MTLQVRFAMYSLPLCHLPVPAMLVTMLQTIRETHANRNIRPGVMATLNLFLETPVGPDADLPPIRAKTDMMLFFKQYCPDPDHPTLKYAGRRVVPKDSKIKVGTALQQPYTCQPMAARNWCHIGSGWLVHACMLFGWP